MWHCEGDFVTATEHVTIERVTIEHVTIEHVTIEHVTIEPCCFSLLRFLFFYVYLSVIVYIKCAIQVIG